MRYNIALSFLSTAIPVMPVIGMNRGKSVKQRFLNAGYSMQELWAISYNGKSTKQLPPSSQCRTNVQVNLSDVTAFVKAVVAYTGAQKIDIISHSKGVVLVRTMMAEPDIAGLVENFVGIAGPNHGTSVCRRARLIWLIGWGRISLGVMKLRQAQRG